MNLKLEQRMESFEKEKHAAELVQLKADYQKAKEQQQSSLRLFEYATDPLMIEAAIYEHRAAQCRCRYLFSLLRSFDIDAVPPQPVTLNSRLEASRDQPEDTPKQVEERPELVDWSLHL